MFAILSLDFWREIQKSLFGKMVDVQKLDGFCSESFGNSTGDRVRNETKYWIFAYCALCHFVNFWGGWKKLSNKGYLGRLISVSFGRWFGNQIVWCVQFLSVCVCTSRRGRTAASRIRDENCVVCVSSCAQIFTLHLGKMVLSLLSTIM